MLLFLLILHDKIVLNVTGKTIYVKHQLWSRSRISLRLWLHQNDAALCSSGSATPRAVSFLVELEPTELKPYKNYVASQPQPVRNYFKHSCF
jgi:hypothetical protein